MHGPHVEAFRGEALICPQPVGLTDFVFTKGNHHASQDDKTDLLQRHHVADGLAARRDASGDAVRAVEERRDNALLPQACPGPTLKLGPTIKSVDGLPSRSERNRCEPCGVYRKFR